MKKTLLTVAVFSAVSFNAFADDDIQDMSDPLAVFTQVGAGYTDKGLNIKLGQTYDTGNPTTAGMNVLELKGAMGDTLGWRDEANDSIDSIRFRNFGVDLTNGRGNQIDVNYDFNTEAGSISYSFIQALPAFGPIQLFPLGGVGAAFGNNVTGDDGETISGYSMPGTFAVIGTYGKFTINDKIWLNYNPMWMTTLSGSDSYKNNAYGENNANILAHEFAASYQFNPRFNVRYFANWTEYTDFKDGDHRIEFNYQI
ncbi:hypothetical protein C9I98_19210 [Photobacterium sanctipauli]|uniref:Porin n=1 Tax=Photobacterium sanctipauli TaxID=1342794 RepID=A0A2T3NNW2_9GAMM|nr:hypothetical protein [Photobacterium sanctipauli]PSW17646.1 hypothetical protein C9I98_19210 [Photobacterium sanctipauli]